MTARASAQVDPLRLVGVHPEAEGEGDGVRRREPARDETVRDLVPDEPDGLEKQARPVLERAAVAAVLAVVGGQRLGDKVAVAGLDVDAVEARRGGEIGRFDEVVPDRGELLVGNERVVGRQAVEGIEVGIVLDDPRLGRSLGLRETARVRQLQDEEGPVARAPFLLRGGADLVDEPGEAADRSLRDEELAGIGAPLRTDRGRLAPDEPAAACGVAPVPAPGRLGGRAAGLGVGPFHGQDGQAVRDRPAGQVRRSGQDGEVFAPGDVDTEARGFGAEIVGRTEPEDRVRGHPGLLPSAAGDAADCLDVALDPGLAGGRPAVARQDGQLARVREFPRS